MGSRLPQKERLLTTEIIMTAYRIVTDKYSGYEVQAKRWWFPFWLQCGHTNTHRSVDAAERWAIRFAEHSYEVKRLGKLPPNVELTGSALLRSPS